ncbi:heterokaryon incompatibility protein-domain-containing protein [Pestalotiopsis sp. NC0098]|nr:heterokaryon incompatibility protein-domain-containing protein [Pestalotiopsis sp. NC0098]
MASTHVDAHVPSTSFEYPPLDKTKSQIRLLEIFPQPDSSLHYSLTTFDISTCPPYIALSYVWGEDEPSNTIFVNGQDFFIRDNLSYVLPRLANLREDGGTSKFQRPESHFWIDDICINQNDTKERNHQVELMKDIFTSASLTAAWLGPDEENLHPLTLPLYKYDRDVNLGRLARNPYFRRMWIVQEVILSRDIWVMCGSGICTWGDLKAYCSIDGDIDLIHKVAGSDIIGNYWFHGWAGYEKLNFRNAEGAAMDSLANLNSVLWSRASHKLRPPTLADLLYLYLDRECRDPRDRVYALLGLLLPETLEANALPVDYDISLEDLFEMVCKYSLRNKETTGYDQLKLNVRIALNLDTTILRKTVSKAQREAALRRMFGSTK